MEFKLLTDDDDDKNIISQLRIIFLSRNLLYRDLRYHNVEFIMI